MERVPLAVVFVTSSLFGPLVLDLIKKLRKHNIELLADYLLICLILLIPKNNPLVIRTEILKFQNTIQYFGPNNIAGLLPINIR